MTNEIIHIGDRAYIKAKVVMLPTEKASRIKYIPIGEYEGGNKYTTEPKLLFVSTPTEFGYEGRHLYFTTNEEIKEGEWFIDLLNNEIYQNTSDITIGSKCRKIVATTDREILYYSGNDIRGRQYDAQYQYPRPSIAFLQKYVEMNGKIDEVLIEMGKICILVPSIDTPEGLYDYKIKIAFDNTITIKPVKDSWNREEIKAVLFNFWSEMSDPYPHPDELSLINEYLDKWMNKNL